MKIYAASWPISMLIIVEACLRENVREVVCSICSPMRRLICGEVSGNCLSERLVSIRNVLVEGRSFTISRMIWVMR